MIHLINHIGNFSGNVAVKNDKLLLVPKTANIFVELDANKSWMTVYENHTIPQKAIVLIPLEMVEEGIRP